MVSNVSVTRGWGWISGTEIVGNLISDGRWGVSGSGSTHYAGTITGLMISDNAIRGNEVGITFNRKVIGASVFHNDFDNLTNADIAFHDYVSNSWDDGYPSGGNWWSDNAGDDLFSGVSQDVPGADGFVDRGRDWNDSVGHINLHESQFLLGALWTPGGAWYPRGISGASSISEFTCRTKSWIGL